MESYILANRIFSRKLMRRLSKGFVLLALLFVPTKVGAGMGGEGY